MNISFNNVDFKSSSGPNNFGQKLAREINSREGITAVTSGQDVQISFIQMTNIFNPTILRLDGIYFNTQQDWKEQNGVIQQSYEAVQHVVVQSEFNKTLVQKYFGEKENISIIRNGTSIDLIDQVPFSRLGPDFEDKDIWMCASSWRPHKRLKANIDYFLEHAPKDTIMLIAGDSPDHNPQNNRVFYVGNLEWHEMISLMKRASTFVHLSWLDHCPNVVVDARACECKIVCSSTGGTAEIAGRGALIIEEEPWDFSPLDLYNPPPLDFSKNRINDVDSPIGIKHAADDYISIARELLRD